MASAPITAVLMVAAIWPFGRDDNDENLAPTIEDLANEEIVIDTEAPISDSQIKAIESYQIFIDFLSSGKKCIQITGKNFARFGQSSAQPLDIAVGVRRVIGFWLFRAGIIRRNLIFFRFVIHSIHTGSSSAWFLISRTVKVHGNNF